MASPNNNLNVNTPQPQQRGTPSPAPSSARTIDRSVARGATAFFSSRLGTPKKKRNSSPREATPAGSSVKDIVNWLETTTATAPSPCPPSERRHASGSLAVSIPTAAPSARTRASTQSGTPGNQTGSTKSAGNNTAHNRQSELSSSPFPAAAGPTSNTFSPGPRTDHGTDEEEFEDEYSLTLLHHRSYLNNRPLARCLDPPSPPAEARTPSTSVSISRPGTAVATTTVASRTSHHQQQQRDFVSSSPSAQKLDRLMRDLSRSFPAPAGEGEGEGEGVAAAAAATAGDTNTESPAPTDPSLSPSPLKVKKQRDAAQGTTTTSEVRTKKDADDYWGAVRSYLRISDEELDGDPDAVIPPFPFPLKKKDADNNNDDGRGAVAEKEEAQEHTTPPRPSGGVPALFGRSRGVARTPSSGSLASSCYSDGAVTPPSPSPAPVRVAAQDNASSVARIPLQLTDGATQGDRDNQQGHGESRGESCEDSQQSRGDGDARLPSHATVKSHSTWYSSSSGSGAAASSRSGSDNSAGSGSKGAAAETDEIGRLPFGELGGQHREETIEEGEESENKDSTERTSHFGDIKADIDRLLDSSSPRETK
ncbi:hypothetical protein NKR23_g7765 [Pleurostoma richardsiae]|uniref:Uncharacterized protein n=1 Tax=Pleurostoma richardsiae TaxID=41990 RepID=A0AA38VMJ2_9PEZI|nr:hypothetical protein NKR23_g7765 [Pleurostoma richardsiae]